jgi:hypothetical protein
MGFPYIFRDSTRFEYPWTASWQGVYYMKKPQEPPICVYACFLRSLTCRHISDLQEYAIHTTAYYEYCNDFYLFIVRAHILFVYREHPTRATIQQSS